MRQSLMAALLLTPLFSASPALAQNKADSPFVWTGKITAGAWLRVQSIRGPIHVIPSSGDQTEVRAEIRNDGDDEIIVQARTVGKDILICAYSKEDECDEEGTHHHGHDRHSRADITVRLGKGTKIDASTGNGDLTVDGAGNDVRVSSGNGVVRVASVDGRVSASSGNGDITVTGASGPTFATTGNGRVSVTTQNGPVNASSGNGDIEVTMSNLKDEGDMHFSTGNGRIIVTVPPSFTGQLETDTGNGSIRTDFAITVTGSLSKHHLRGQIGTGDRRIHMSTGNGDLELRRGT
ncbi:MAG TPA: DUF4097 family beta strand repeat-containing protein [Gemmatimonadaceae bacterium]|nr:DUF4097 family beta strand repeat-containing protein [Gemmatimonadaceae bacterium]